MEQLSDEQINVLQACLQGKNVFISGPGGCGKTYLIRRAITIHKSQGITLDSAIIDAGDNIFEYGQIYVALSRVRSLDGLYLCEFNGRKIMTNPEVIKYFSLL